MINPSNLDLQSPPLLALTEKTITTDNVYKTKYTDGFILKFLDNLPNSEFLKMCETLQQIEYWSNLKTYYTNLKMLLKHYFHGTHCYLEKLHPKNKEYWLNNRDLYLALYDLIQEDWVNIKNNFEECEYFFKQPYELFCFILKEEADFEFSKCTNNTEIELTRYSPTKLYKIYQKPETYIELNTSRIKKWRLHVAFHFACINIVEKSSKSNLRLKQKLKEYHNYQGKILDFMYSSCHPRKKQTGYQWIDGVKAPIANKRS